jgi:hypothetical protein
MRHSPKEQTEAKRGNKRSQHLREPVGSHSTQWEVASQHKTERHSGIELRAAELSGGVDHRGDHRPKDQSYADMSDLPTGDSINDDGATACEDKRKSPDAFGDTDRSQGR